MLRSFSLGFSLDRPFGPFFRRSTPTLAVLRLIAFVPVFLAIAGTATLPTAIGAAQNGPVTAAGEGDPTFATDGTTAALAPYALSPAPTGRIIVKFHEESGLRSGNGTLAASPEVADAPTTAARVTSLLGRHAAAFDLGRHFGRPEAALDAERAAAEARSGRDLPDLNTYARLTPRASWTAGELEDVLRALRRDPAVETVFLEPVAVPAALGFDAFAGVPGRVAARGGALSAPADAPGAASGASRDLAARDAGPAPATPDYTGSQGYLDAAPNGVDAEGAWLLPGGRGTNVKVIDIEGAWLWTHEDLPAPFFTAGGEIFDSGWRNHGTAVLGEIRGAINAYGVTGIAAEVQVGACSIANLSVAEAINTAAAALAPGDIFLIELHAPGPNANGSGQYGYVCMEFWQDNFDAIQIASALGRICCEAAGNGEQNLDDPVYGGLFDRDVRDSGAIICGATDGGSLFPAWFTNYGERVDLHGWGFNVVTCGYGDLQGGPETQWYTAGFSGTSSASPIVVGAVASLQGLVEANLGVRLDATLARQLLVSTGTPQSGSNHIGPRPNITAAWAVAQNGVGEVAGLVTEDGVGTPLAGIAVSLLETESHTTTGAAGTFSLPLLAGDYTLVFSSPFFETTEVPITVVSGGVADGDVALVRRPTVALEGIVRSAENGAALSGVRVTPQVPWLGETVTGLTGTWSIAGAPEGNSYELAFDRRPGYGADWATLTVPENPGPGDAFLQVQLPAAGEDFEGDNGGFAASSYWSWGVPSAGGPNSGFSGTRCWGVGMTGDYPDNAFGTLTSPFFDFSGESELRLSFHYWSETENCFDGVNVDVWNGSSWELVAPFGGYQCGSLGGLEYEDGWSGSTGAWVGAVFDLAAYIGPNVRFRLSFGSDGGVTGQGFWVDEIAFDTGDATTAVDPSVLVSAAPRLTAVPNPFAQEVRIELRLDQAEEAEVALFDASGRRVRSLFGGELAAGGHSLSWDGRDDRGLLVPAGVYFARLGTESGAVTRERIVLAR